MVVVTHSNPGWLKALLKRYRDTGRDRLALGFPVGSEGAGLRYPDGTPLLTVAAANQFGAHIDHPGGTRYVLDAQGRAKFVGSGHTGPVAGVTQAHEIDIPARDFFTPGAVAATVATEPIRKAGVKAINRGKATAAEVLEKMGPFAESAMKKAIADFTDPPNAASTIARKGDDNPLEDTGMMRNAVTYVVRTAK